MYRICLVFVRLESVLMCVCVCWEKQKDHFIKMVVIVQSAGSWCAIVLAPSFGRSGRRRRHRLSVDRCCCSCCCHFLSQRLHNCALALLSPTVLFSLGFCFNICLQVQRNTARFHHTLDTKICLILRWLLSKKKRAYCLVLFFGKWAFNTVCIPIDSLARAFRCLLYRIISKMPHFQLAAQFVGRK